MQMQAKYEIGQSQLGAKDINQTDLRLIAHTEI